MMKRPLVGVGVLVRKKDSYLLIKRHNSHGEGTWSPPGGHLEFGETLEQCAIRETREETSLLLEMVIFLGITNDFFEAEGKHYITIWMEAKRFKGEAKINSSREMTEIGWFSLNQLPTPLFLPFDKLVNKKYYF
jgi:8-oxo-dGTP diphosphatase